MKYNHTIYENPAARSTTDKPSSINNAACGAANAQAEYFSTLTPKVRSHILPLAQRLGYTALARETHCERRECATHGKKKRTECQSFSHVLHARRLWTAPAKSVPTNHLNLGSTVRGQYGRACGRFVRNSFSPPEVLSAAAGSQRYFTFERSFNLFD